MPDTLTTITNFINSPPGQVVAGAALAGIVWKFFERVESVLNENTKLEIAVWLLGVKIGQKVEPWPETFAKVFDRVFGTKHLTWRCFWRSCLASYGVALIGFLFVLQSDFRYISPRSFVLTFLVPGWFILALVGNVFPDYLSLLETRYLLRASSRSKSVLVWLAFLIADLIITLLIARLSVALIELFGERVLRASVRYLWNSDSILDKLVFLEQLGFLPMIQHPFALWIAPAFFTSLWLWLYAGSGFILKAARTLDLGFDWFNLKFDIEKKPLQSIGLVSGALVALLYWTAALFRHFVS
jgi:hypothetical protein